MVTTYVQVSIRVVTSDSHIVFSIKGSHRQHALYIWDKTTGNLVKMLTGQKGESLLDLSVRSLESLIH